MPSEVLAFKFSQNQSAITDGIRTSWMNIVHLTESPFNRRPFDRKFILPKGHKTIFSENGHLPESNFDKKCHLTEKKLRTRSFDRKFI
jgi:hypothetical protein